MLRMSHHQNKLAEFAEGGSSDGKIARLIEEALLEDIGIGDVTTDLIVPPNLVGKGEIIVKESGVLAGLSIASLVFENVDASISFKPLCDDGCIIESTMTVATVEGPFAGILKAERTALNFLQRMSGIATLTKKFVDAVRGTRAKITDTRKTVPGLRLIDKLAVQLGGGINHRFGLDDMILIKDNHIAAAGNVTAAIERCRASLKTASYKLKIEVETKNLDEVQEVLRFPEVDRIMLDNFPLDEMRKAVHLINRQKEVEASGGVSLINVREIAETGVDFISIGALTHSAKALDISLEVSPLKKILNR
jgi:nicotinate-nucleotide pyrophosphorylase (carboxylating)